MADENQKRKSGFVVGRDPGAELAELRKILSSSGASRASRLTRNLREANERAQSFAERDVEGVLNS